MTKMILIVGLFFSVESSADLVADGYKEIRDQNYTNARVLWSKACEKGNAVGCYNIGLMYDYGDGVESDRKTADYFYKKACNMGSDRGCYDYVNRTDSHSTGTLE